MIALGSYSQLKPIPNGTALAFTKNINYLVHIWDDMSIDKYLTTQPDGIVYYKTPPDAHGFYKYYPILYDKSANVSVKKQW